MTQENHLRARRLTYAIAKLECALTDVVSAAGELKVRSTVTTLPDDHPLHAQMDETKRDVMKSLELLRLTVRRLL
jgi:hypothetical protein